MKKILIVALLCIILPTVYSATVLNYEDFENYSTFNFGNTTAIQNWFDVESAGRWNCTTAGEYPSCLSFAAGGASGIANFSVTYEGDNNFLSIYALNWDCATPKFWNVRLQYDNRVNSYTAPYPTPTDFIITYKMRYVASNSVVGCGAQSYREQALINSGGSVGTNMPFLNGLGQTNTYTNQTFFDRVKGYADATLSPQQLRPIDPPQNCDISDGAWHTIKTVQRVNTSNLTNANYLTNYSVYIDNNLCLNISNNFYKGVDLSPIYTNVTLFQVQAGYWVNFDDIYYYVANSSEDFLGTVYECSDGIDNDADGLIDYPDDPSCTATSDDTETPFSSTQCNNGIDDDVDGYTDYPYDPSCTSLGGSTEWPQQGTVQNFTQCYLDDKCIIADMFPYTDNISLHGWWGSFSYPFVDNVYGSKKLAFGDTGNFTAYLNYTNPNIYSEIIAEFDVLPEISGFTETSTEEFYVVMKDDDGRVAVKLKIKVEPTTTYPYMKITLYNILSNNSAEYLIDFTPTDYGIKSVIQFKLYIDQQLKTYHFTFTIDGTPVEFLTDKPFYNNMATVVDYFGIENINLSYNDWTVYFDNIDIYGDVIGRADTVCDEFQAPYYLIESFNGYPVECGWSTSNDDLYFLGKFTITPTTPRYYIQKEIDTIKEATSRYVSVTWDMNVKNITGIGQYVMRLYDTENTNFFSTYILDAAPVLYYNRFGTSASATNITLNTDANYLLIIDSEKDNFDLYVNGSPVVTDGGFYNEFYNLQEWNTVKIDTSYFGIEIDNVKIYTSDENGNPVLPSEIAKPKVDNETTMCGLFIRKDYTCLNDEDCASGDCMANNKCNKFDMTYCDDNGYIRGNKCIAAAISSCFFSSTTDIIFDNFFYVLLAILMIMGLVYLSILFRRRR